MHSQDGNSIYEDKQTYCQWMTVPIESFRGPRWYVWKVTSVMQRTSTEQETKNIEKLPRMQAWPTRGYIIPWTRLGKLSFSKKTNRQILARAHKRTFFAGIFWNRGISGGSRKVNSWRPIENSIEEFWRYRCWRIHRRPVTTLEILNQEPGMTGLGASSLPSGLTNLAKFSSDIDGSLEGSLSNFVEMNDTPDMLIHPDDPKVRDNIAIELLKHLVGLPKYSLAGLVFTVIKDTGGFMTAENRKLHRQKLAVLRQELLDLLGNDGVLLYPTMHCTAFKHHTSYLNMPGVMFTMLFNIIGFPATHIPMGLSKQGLPVGFQVVAAPYQDRLCLAIAEDLEKKFGGWVPPS